MFSTEITKRGVTYVGMKCNVKCCFCYYGRVPKSHRQWTPLERMEKEFEMMQAIGMTHVDITGGEPSIYPHITESIDSARFFGLAPRIITNGVVCNTSVLRDWRSAGIDSLLISLQSSDRHIHDEMVKGGSWYNTFQCMLGCAELGIPFSINTTVCRPNYESMPMTSQYVGQYGATAHNMIMLNPFCWPNTYAKKNRLYVRQVDAAPYLMEACDDTSCHKTVRYMSFCRMKGYEHQIMNWHQLPYDDNEWNYMAWHADYYGMLLTPGDYFAVCDHEVGVHYKKGTECYDCAARKICGGFKERVYGFDYTMSPRPEIYEGDVIEDPLHFWRAAQ